MLFYLIQLFFNKNIIIIFKLKFSSAHVLHNFNLNFIEFTRLVNEDLRHAIHGSCSGLLT